MPELGRPQRKNLRLSCFDYSGNCAYFITICVQNRLHLFGKMESTPVGAHLCVRPHAPEQMVIVWLQEMERKFPGTDVTDYIVMPDHVHFILFYTAGTVKADLPQMIQWFKTQTTNAYIRGVRNGWYLPFDRHLWQRGYYEHVIRNEQDLADTRAYIQNNPVQWALRRADT